MFLTLVDECTCVVVKPFFSYTDTFLMSLQPSACPQVSSIVSGVELIISEPSDFRSWSASGSGSGVSTGSGSDSGSDSGSSGVSSTSSSTVKLAALIRGIVKINDKLIYWVSNTHTPWNLTGTELSPLDQNPPCSDPSSHSQDPGSPEWSS